MALIANAVFDAALSYIASNGVEAEVQTAAGAALVDAITLDSGNYGSPGDNGGAGGGRLIECLVNDGGDMNNINVDSAGDASKIAIKTGGAAVLIEADITGAPVTLGASDQVNLGSFNVILKDPT